MKKYIVPIVLSVLFLQTPLAAFAAAPGFSYTIDTTSSGSDQYINTVCDRELVPSDEIYGGDWMTIWGSTGSEAPWMAFILNPPCNDSPLAASMFYTIASVGGAGTSAVITYSENGPCWDTFANCTADSSNILIPAEQIYVGCDIVDNLTGESKYYFGTTTQDNTDCQNWAPPSEDPPEE